ncbi:MAG: hypothetical protein KF915_16730 [Polyangiaceae bacterium]|nr:hypothetical protein [Polyangiaceae bacterium]
MEADEEALDPAIYRPASTVAAPSEDTPEGIAERLRAEPDHPRAAELRQRHDALLAPCVPASTVPSGATGPQVASCNPEHPLLAEGVLARAERYLAECLDCRDRNSVTALRTRMRQAAPTARRELAYRSLELGLAAGDVALAQQTIADHASLGEPFLGYARRKLSRRFSPEVLAGDLGDPACSSGALPGSGSAWLLSPERPRAGESFRILTVSESDLPGAVIELRDTRGERRESGPGELRRGGGPPWFWWTEAELPEGRYRVTLTREGRVVSCRRFNVGGRSAPSERGDGELWRAVRGWDRDYENLYSAWISVLFDAPEATTWRGFHSVTQERERNLLFGHLGLGEDREAGENAVRMTPDCADAPHFFRAYFAWKLGLPFAYHRCRFGSPSGAPKCADWTTNQGVVEEPSKRTERAGTAKRAEAAEPAVRAEPDEADEPGELAVKDGDRAESVSKADAGGADRTARASGKDGARRAVPFVRFSEPRDPPGVELTRFFGLIKNEITARSLRTDFTDSATDLYPVPLTKDALRPGAVYSDPYGHTYTLVRWIAQTESSPGVLLAVDAQPDETLNIKRFWRGNFLFSAVSRREGHGFKAFRPIVQSDVPGQVRQELSLLSNAQIALARGYGNYSAEQAALDVPGFYGRMEQLINPSPLSPVTAYKELHRALHRQLRQRVREIDLAEEYRRRNPGEVIPMPEGQAIFRTTGPWEALSTPCRDLRLLVGVDALRDFPEQVIRVAPQSDVLREHLAALHRKWSAEMIFSYTRSDGVKQRLTLAEALGRVTALELGWNPNDCPERRWGAPEGSAEASACTSRAPEEQAKRMEAFRHWFARRYSCG